MKYLPAVSRAEYRGDFRILVTFSDGSENTIDFQQWLEGPMFDPLKNGRISRVLRGWRDHRLAERCGRRT